MVPLEESAPVGGAPGAGSGFCTASTCGRCCSEVTLWPIWPEMPVSGPVASCSTICALVPPALGACAASTCWPVCDWTPGSEKSSE